MEGLSSDRQPEWHPRPVELPEPALVRDSFDGLTPTERLEAGRPQLEQLVMELASDIKAGRWDAILGDDVSSRIPTLILRQVIARSYTDSGRPTPKTYFIAMGQEFSITDEDIDERIGQIQSYLASGNKPQRVLFVTDNIAQGGSIRTVLDGLDKIGIAADVASVQESADLVQYISGRKHYDSESAIAATNKLAAEGLINDEADKLARITGFINGVGHDVHDPQAKYYGVENPIHHPTTQPFHLAARSRRRGRDAVNVEKYGGPITEGQRQHALRELHGNELNLDEHVANNPDVAELRQAAKKMAANLYDKYLATDQKEA